MASAIRQSAAITDSGRATNSNLSVAEPIINGTILHATTKQTCAAMNATSSDTEP